MQLLCNGALTKFKLVQNVLLVAVISVTKAQEMDVDAAHAPILRKQQILPGKSLELEISLI